jgi:predicted nucleic acid-binding protein
MRGERLPRTNILVYAQQDGLKATTAQNVIARGGLISAQVLNELVSVLRSKQKRSWDDIALVLDDVENALDPALPLTSAISRAALGLARVHGLQFYDALIVATALEAGCDTLFSEDMQHGRALAASPSSTPSCKAPLERSIPCRKSLRFLARAARPGVSYQA